MLDQEQSWHFGRHVMPQMTDEDTGLYCPDLIEQPIATAPSGHDPPLACAVSQDPDQVACGTW
jgi:hypothetical protein